MSAEVQEQQTVPVPEKQQSESTLTSSDAQAASQGADGKGRHHVPAQLRDADNDVTRAQHAEVSRDDGKDALPDGLYVVSL